MLGKLFRNEIKCTGKNMLIIFAMIVASTTLGCLVLGVDTLHSNSKVGNLLSIIFILSYIFAIVFLFLGTFIYACQRFYKSMYSDMGYLTHTLPVSPLANLNVRILTSLLWMILSGAMMIVSIAALLISSSKGDILRELGHINYKLIDEVCRAIFGYGVIVSFGVVLLVIVVSCLQMLLLVYAAFSIGQLSNRHKVGSAVGWGIGIYFAQQILSSAFMVGFNKMVFATTYVTVKTSETGELYTSTSFPHALMWTTIGITALYALIEYVICAVIVKKRVNLE